MRKIYRYYSDNGIDNVFELNYRPKIELFKLRNDIASNSVIIRSKSTINNINDVKLYISVFHL